MSLLNQFYLTAFISSNYYMYEATSYAGSYVQAGKETHSPWYMKSIGLSEALGMLLGPQRLQGWANGSENQGQEHTASGSSEPFPSPPMTGDLTWEGAGCWGQTCLAGLSLEHVCCSLYVREWPARLLLDPSSRRPDLLKSAFSASFRTPALMTAPLTSFFSTPQLDC